MVWIHPSIKEAIENFHPPAGYVMVLLRRNKASVIFTNGVRVPESPEFPATTVPVGASSVWLSLAIEPCRKKVGVFYPLSAGKHQRQPDIFAKSMACHLTKRLLKTKKALRNDALDRFQMSEMYRDDPTRVYVLMGTLRIVYNNLPFRLAGYEESISIRELVMKDNMKASVTAKVVSHAIIELYSSSKQGVIATLKENRIATVPTLCPCDRNLTREATSAARSRDRDGPGDRNPTIDQDIKSSPHDLTSDYSGTEEERLQSFESLLTGVIKLGDVKDYGQLVCSPAAQYTGNLPVLPSRVGDVGEGFVGLRHIPGSSIKNPLRYQPVDAIGVLNSAAPERVRCQGGGGSRRFSNALEHPVHIRLDSIFTSLGMYCVPGSASRMSNCGAPVSGDSMSCVTSSGSWSSSATLGDTCVASATASVCKGQVRKSLLSEVKSLFFSSLDAQQSQCHIKHARAASCWIQNNHIDLSVGKTCIFIRIGSKAFFTIVVDFWSSLTKGAKFVGLRLYFIDNPWNFQSILLGTRHFYHRYSVRAGGVRAPFLRWVTELLGDFELRCSDLFGATTDGGADVKLVMQSGMMLNWEWCIPHLTNPATKQFNKSKNPPMTDLFGRIVKPIYQTKHVEVMGSLFRKLCELGTDDGARAPQQLLDYKAHRFLGLTRVVRRISLLWTPLSAWYDERLAKAAREGKNHRQYFRWPIYEGEQCTLTGSTDAIDLKYEIPAAASFSTDFFSRYTDRQKISKCLFVLECQLFLHPNFKNLDGVLKDVGLLYSIQEGLPRTTAEGNIGQIKHVITNTLRDMMKAVRNKTEFENMLNFPPPLPVVFSEDLMELFANTPSDTIESEQQQDVDDARVEDELQRCIMARTTLRQNEDQIESNLAYWKRQEETGTYEILPRVARIIYAIPVSSAQIERDFDVAGLLVTPQRSSIAPHTICKRDYVDVTQCERIPANEVSLHLPGNVLVSMDSEDDANFEVMLNDYFSDESGVVDDEN
ncbi:LOW QUALITY PROTEIN: hypothetical protein PHMEG_00015717 [Phytophthora megakarya]|uniref:HAT C-terminal dimerisation domain-containing protein n=1 Tax=Phytophthora megakarya TaxID=4795 RepID=A0A225W0Q7_9STRA|nr:LOW QUALITY PROTEIN: hypothetical protein PHMEG_00015717 [Phytophthora megakarya]